MSEFNSTSPLRSGFDYQDLWTLRLCGEWLLNPQKYKWIQIEANPTEEPFFLDDIVLFDGAKYHFYQAKFKTDENDEWGWEDFISKRKGKKAPLPSLLYKWTTSASHVGYDNIEKIALITNGTLSNKISSVISDKKIDIEKIQKETPELYEKIIAEVCDGDIRFFNKFEIIFENNDIDTIEKEIVKDIFQKSLFATINGINNLLLSLKKEARKKTTIQMTIDMLKRWCEFDNPQPLNEDFEIPKDFQLFDENIHNKLLKDLMNPEGGIKVITGKPGTGKSVYLSELSENLINNGTILIKHHYHINPSDRKHFERLNSERVAEAIKAQFKNSNNMKYLGELADKNSAEIPLKDFISTVAGNLSNKGKSFVIMIDGLDHVVREKDVHELKDFLDEIFYPQSGLWIVFGMQSQIRNEPCLQAIFRKCPDNSWVEINGVNKEAVYNIIIKNTSDLNLPTEEDELINLINKLFELTKGNPLHLRYTLGQLKNFNKSIVREYDCENLVPYGDNIQDYYASLWQTLEEKSRSFLLTLLSVGFIFSEKQYVECISSFCGTPDIISRNLKSITHLTTVDRQKKIRIFHNSFQVFMLNQKEWEEQKNFIRQTVKNWLENSKYEDLKWAELAKLEYNLGNDTPILKLDRDWLIESISYPRNPDLIRSQLKVCYKAALKKNDFAKALKISHLNRYYKYLLKYQDDSYKFILTEAIRLNPEIIDELVLIDLPSEVLSIAVEYADQHDQLEMINGIIDILNDRMKYQDYNGSSVNTIIKVIPFDRDHEVKRVYQLIIQFRKNFESTSLFSEYSEKLLILNQKKKIVELLSCNLEQEEELLILENCISYDFTQKISYFIEYIKKIELDSPLAQLYLHIYDNKSLQLIELPKYDEFPLTIKDYGEERGIWADKFKNFFIQGLTYALSSNEKNLTGWIKSAPSNWPIEATKLLFISSIRIASSIKQEKRVYYNDIFGELNQIEDLHWPEDRNKIEFKFAFMKALEDILRIIIDLKIYLGDSLEICENDYKLIISSPFFREHNLLKLIINSNIPLLERNVFDKFSYQQEKETEQLIDVFSQRSENYIDLVRLNRIYQNHKKASELLRKAVDNSLGYGYHKDTYLFEVLDAIELCAEASVNKKIINNWIDRIIPMVVNATKFTDGDETDYLPDYLSDFLSKYNQELLLKFHYFQAEKEMLFSAQDSFKYVLRSFSFSNEIEQALATTALDKNSLKELKEKSKTNTDAHNSLNIIQDYLGEINYEEEKYSSYDYKEENYNYDQILPEKLEEHLRAFEPKWEVEKYIVQWTKYWLKNDDPKKIYHLLKSIVLETNDIKHISGGTLDLLYPLAYEFDKKKSFEFLCFAQINDHGWQKYWTSPQKAKDRWEYLSEIFPERYLEFFKITVENEIPLERGVEYFIHLNKIDTAQKIAEAGLEFAEELMANICLPAVEWSKDSFKEVSYIDLLFQRLIWPTPLVRERAATAIANLITTSPEREGIYNKLLFWIKEQQLETIIAIGLLPITKTLQACKNAEELPFINIESVTKSIKVSSVVIEELIRMIAEIINQKVENFPNYPLLIKEVPNGKEYNFFNKYIKSILPPIYFSQAINIETKTNYPFTKLWAYNAEIVAKQLNIELAFNSEFYGSNENGKFLLGLSTKVSELYRSVFLRVLSDAYSKGYIESDFYFDYSFATLPIDLSFWQISPNRMPKWWPMLENDEKVNNNEKNITKIQFKTSIEDIVNYKNNGKIVLAADGAICQANGWFQSPEHSFELIGFFYRVLGPNLPSAEKIAEEILYKPKTISVPSKAEYPLSFLTNSDNIQINCDPFKIGDLGVLPIVARNHHLAVSFWQYYRNKSYSLNINNEAFSNFKIEIEDEEWTCKNENGKEIIVFKDWLEGLQERSEFNMPFPHGQYLLIDEEFLMETLNLNDLRLGFLLKTVFRQKEHSYSEVKKFEEYKFINVSNLILERMNYLYS